MDSRWNDFVVGIFLTNLYFRCISFKSKFFPIINFTVNFIHFYNVFKRGSRGVAHVAISP